MGSLAPHLCTAARRLRLSTHTAASHWVYWWQVSCEMRVARLVYMFRMLGATSACVVEEGRVLGVITRVDLFESV